MHSKCVHNEEYSFSLVFLVFFLLPQLDEYSTFD